MKEAFELCPLDGRYSDIKELMSPYFSEYAYFQKRVFVEIEWLLYLIDTKVVNYKGDISKIKEISSKYDMNSYLEIKKQENITKHDVKAVEYFIDEKLKENNLSDLVSYVHFTLTSEDVNNVAYALMIKEFLNEVYYSKVEELLYYFSILSKKYKNISVLAHTHGQPATPTTFKKEFNVYIYRIKNELKRLKKTKIMAKFNGATGNYSAIKIALPNIDVVSFSKKFITSLNLTFNPLTTQIENHDYIVNILDNIRHINNIILDLDLDMWLYISKSYFKLKVVENEVGSSTMPHKVNPINFENSESNLETANSLLVMLSNKLPKSRMQRDLSDSSSLRNLGIAFGYSLQSIKETLKGLKRVEINKKVVLEELAEEWEVLAEAIQTVLRKYQIGDAYNQLKKLTRGKKVSKEMLHEFIENLNISQEDKKILLELTPSNYVGLANKL